VRIERPPYEWVPDPTAKILVADRVPLLGRERRHVGRMKVRLHQAEDIAEPLGELYIIGPATSLLAVDSSTPGLKVHVCPAEVDGFGVTTACLGQKQDEREVVRCSALGDFEKSFSLIRIQCLALFYRAEA
jgi:hypothetical protein